MTTWVLIFYMSVGMGQTGGPAAVDGFTSYQSCMQAGDAISKLPKYDWHKCVEVKK
jgi:hypothetical protein